MNFGSFAGGVADGYRKQEENQRLNDENKRRQEDAERKRKADEREETYRKELDSIQTPDDAHKAKLAEYEKAKKKAESDSADAKTAEQIVGNSTIYSQGINLPAAGTAPRSFSEDVAQRSEASGLVADKPATSPARSIVLNGIDSATAVRNEIAKPQQIAQPEAPAEPGFADHMDYFIKRAAVDMRHGKVDGLGMMQLMQAKKQLDEEGFRDAFLQIHNGDIQGGIAAFNQYGKRRVRLVDAKPIEADIGGIKMQSHVVTFEDENGKRQTINAAQALNGFRKMENQLSSAMEMMKFRQSAKHQDESLAESRDYHRGVIDVARNKATSGGGLTVPQQRTNAEIDAARTAVAGMSQEEIQRRTQQYSATGRINDEYDPMLASKVRLSQHRKYGEDTEFANIADPGADAMPDIGARFATDPVMKGHRLGNKTPQGVEVFDANGKLIGHYN
ncbi:MAG: hypothetical protein WA056_10045 [Gallionella sp.]